MKRVFQIDITTCNKCGDKLKVVAAILEKKVIEKILTHLGLETKAPAIHPARATPVLALLLMRSLSKFAASLRSHF